MPVLTRPRDDVVVAVLRALLLVVAALGGVAAVGATGHAAAVKATCTNHPKVDPKVDATGQVTLTCTAAGYSPATATLTLAPSASSTPTPTVTPTPTPTPTSTATTAPTGFPDATTTGVRAGVTLVKVPQQVTSGPGWSWNPQNETAEIRTPGTTFSGYDVTGNVDIDADNVTIVDTSIENDSYYAVEIRAVQHATITHSTIGGIPGGRYCDNAIRPIYGTEDDLTITYNNLQRCSSMINEPSRGGLIAENYLHDFGDNPGGQNHFNGIQLSGGCHGSLMTIRHNTILNNADQSNAIALSTDECAEANRLVQDNLLGGGSYTVYGGGEQPESNVKILDNTFARAYRPGFGPIGYPPRPGNGDACTGNHYDDGAPIAC